MKVAKISHIARAKAAFDIAEMKASNAAHLMLNLISSSEYLQQFQANTKKHDVAQVVCCLAQEQAGAKGAVATRAVKKLTNLEECPECPEADAQECPECDTSEEVNKIKKEFRNEKLFILFILNFMLRSEYDLENISFM